MGPEKEGFRQKFIGVLSSPPPTPRNLPGWASLAARPRSTEGESVIFLYRLPSRGRLAQGGRLWGGGVIPQYRDRREEKDAVRFKDPDRRVGTLGSRSPR